MRSKQAEGGKYKPAEMRSPLASGEVKQKSNATI
jgi:hypothetical protein